jgi:hypothetical protein
MAANFAKLPKLLRQTTPPARHDQKLRRPPPLAVYEPA